jgi:ribose transport system ATP-binding protein
LIFRVEGISKTFPGVRALDKVDLEVNGGEILAVVGENGAGKSTLMKILAGAYRRDEGRIILKGTPVDFANPLLAQRAGISIIYQELNLTRNQTVAANIFMVREPLHRGLGRWLRIVDRRRMEREAQGILDRINAKISAKTRVGNLPVAQRQMVEIAKALAVDAQILIMDEPTAALGGNEVETLFDIARSLKERGMAVIFITHRLNEVFTIADRITVMRDGKLVGTAPIAELTREKVVHMMVGRELSEFIHKEKTEISEPVLEVKGLTRKGVLENISFSLRRGEVLGFTGLVGAGRTETARAIFGADPRDAGEIVVEGRPVKIHSPRDAVEAGISLIPEDRAQHGLVLKLSVFNNIVLASLPRYSRAGWLRRAEMVRIADGFVDQMQIRTPALSQKTMYLSGGNQQKVVLAKWLASHPKVLIMDEPTRGIDVGSKAEVYSLMGKLAASGMGIIFISSELPEIMGLSDRIAVMHEGRIEAILDRESATQELIMSYASGQMPRLS